MSIKEETCPDCGDYKYPFDVHCDECNRIGYFIDDKTRLFITEILATLGYSFEFIVNSTQLSIKVPRKDAAALKSLLKKEEDAICSQVFP